MQGVGRIQHYRGRACAGKRRGNLRADVSRFAHADDYDFATRVDRLFDQLNRAGEIFIQPFSEALEFKNFQIEDACGLFKRIHRKIYCAQAWLWATFRTARTKGKHEDIDDRNRGCAGGDGFRARIQSTDRSAKTGARNREAAAGFRTSSSWGRTSESIRSGSQPASNAQSLGAGPLRDLGGEHIVRSQPSRKMERH